MSKPVENYDDKLYGIVTELTSALSSLNMESRPIPEAIEEARKGNIQGFLSETEFWAKHSYEHIEAAFHMAIKLIEERDR